MFKSIIFAVVLCIIGTASAFAANTTASGELSWSNRFFDRGVVLSNDPSAQLQLQVDNVIVPGVFVQTQLATIRPLEDSLTVYSNFGVGYRTQLSIFDGSVSFNRIENSVYNGGHAYTDGRVELGATIYDGLRLYVHGDQPLSSQSRDTYYGVGVSYNPAWFSKLTVAAEGNMYHFGGTHNSQFNNAELKATYNLWKNVNLFAMYSYGGTGLTREFPNLSGYVSEQPLPNAWNAGVSLTF